MRFYTFFSFFLFALSNTTKSNLWLNCSLFATLHSTPTPVMNTEGLVPPAEINGSEMHVGGLDPLNTIYCTMNLA